MAKFTDIERDRLISFFQTGDQPTQAQFTEWITRLQEGIEDHDHDGTGDGDGIKTLGGVLTLDAANSRVGVKIAAPAYNFQVNENLDAHVTIAAFLNPGAATAGRFTYMHLGKSAVAGGCATLGYFSDTATPANARVALGNQGDAENTEYLNLLKDGYLSLGTQTPTGLVHFKVGNAAAAIPVLVLEQADASEGTINFVASARPAITGATNSIQSVRVELSGVVYRLALYADA